MPTLIFPRGIVILKDLDKITIENPGSIITGKLQMLKGGISEPRNKIIMKMFNLIRVGERAGSGVPDIFSVWDEEGWTEPVVEELYQPDRTILRLSFENRYGKNSAIQSQNSAIQSPKSAIHPEKISLEGIIASLLKFKYNESTRKNIEKIYLNVEANQVFGAAEVKEMLGCSDSTARAVIAKLRDDINAIIPVKGQGKAKYRFMNTDD